MSSVSLSDSEISKAVDDGFATQAAFLEQLVRFPSTRGNEHTVQDFMARSLRERDYFVDLFEMDRAALGAHPGSGEFSGEHSQAPVVVGIHRPKSEVGCSLIIQGHVDVIPTEPGGNVVQGAV